MLVHWCKITGNKNKGHQTGSCVQIQQLWSTSNVVGLQLEKDQFVQTGRPYLVVPLLDCFSLIRGDPQLNSFTARGRGLIDFL